jgi:uncharacterized Ntn-hydrolase superfamily protein
MRLATPLSETALRARQGTYSIVARDPGTGEFGVAVQSHWFSVGAVVPWAMPGVGLVAADAGGHGRQVAVIDAAGRVAVHTGSQCMPHAGHVTGDGVSCQANIMASPSVWGAMMDAFQANEGRLRDRLLAALDAGERAGGDIRGRQSAAILVVPAEGESWESNVSLRVEDHPEPLIELRRLLVLHDAYVLAGRGDAMVNQRDYAEAARLYQRASALAPDSIELRFWSGLGTAQLGDLSAGIEEVRSVIARSPGWASLISELPDTVMPSIPAVRAGLGIG